MCREGSNAEQPPVSEEDRQAWFRSMWEGDGSKDAGPAGTEISDEEAKDEKPKNDDDDDDDDDDLGDDFDDFAEGQEGGDDDFGDFDDADETPMAPEPKAQPPPQPQLPDALAGLVSSAHNQANPINMTLHLSYLI